MRTYIFFNNKKLPSGVGAMEYIYDKSFRKQLFSGGRYSKRLPKLPYAIQFRWPKWIDNPDAPDYTRFTSIDLCFSPFHKDLRVGKRIINYSKELGFKYVALADIYTVHTSKNVIAEIDLRTYLRTIYFYAKECNGIIYIPLKNRVLKPDPFYKQYKKYIEHSFNRKLKKSDYRKIKLKEIF
jgi:hypothetical protein